MGKAHGMKGEDWVLCAFGHSSTSPSITSTRPNDRTSRFIFYDELTCASNLLDFLLYVFRLFFFCQTDIILIRLNLGLNSKHKPPPNKQKLVVLWVTPIDVILLILKAAWPLWPIPMIKSASKVSLVKKKRQGRTRNDGVGHTYYSNPAFNNWSPFPFPKMCNPCSCLLCGNIFLVVVFLFKKKTLIGYEEKWNSSVGTASVDYIEYVGFHPFISRFQSFHASKLNLIGL